MSPSRHGGDFRDGEIKNIRRELDQRDPKEREKAEKRARARVEKVARNSEEKKALLAMIFGGK